MQILSFSVSSLRRSLRAGWRLAAANRLLSAAYTLIFTLVGGAIIGALLHQGWTPFIPAAAGAFMLLGPVLLAGFFGIAKASEAGRQPTWRDVLSGFADASPVLGVLALVCGLLFLIFVSDAAILYAYMIGAPAIAWGPALGADNIRQFVVWAGVSGAFIAFLLYVVTVFSVPVLCERRAGLVQAVVISVRAVFLSFGPAILWAMLLGSIIMTSVVLLPLLPLTLPWLAFSSRALYREVLPL